MTYTVTVSRAAEKEMQHIGNPWFNKISAAIEKLAHQPRPQGCKKLKGFKDLWRVRVADYRVIYAVNDTVRIVSVERVAHRKESYD